MKVDGKGVWVGLREISTSIYFYISYFYLSTYVLLLFWIVFILDILTFDVVEDSRSNLHQCIQHSKCSALCINFWIYVKVWLLCKSRSKVTTFLRMCNWRKKFTMRSPNVDCEWALFFVTKFFSTYWKWLPPALITSRHHWWSSAPPRPKSWFRHYRWSAIYYGKSSNHKT